MSGQIPSVESEHIDASEVGISDLVIDTSIFLGIFLFALLIRLVFVFQMRNCPIFEHPLLDSELHDQWARMILAGQTMFTGAYFKAPLYPAFLATIYQVVGSDYLVPRLVQAALGAASCGLLFLVGKESFSRAVGAIAGFAAATYWILIFYDAELLLEPLSIFFNLLALWLMMRAAKGQGWRLWLLAGLALGLSAITRPNVLVFMPVAALWVLWIYWNNKRIAWSRGILFGLGCILPIVPITIRNYVAGHELVLIASQGGPNFYIGNNLKSDGMSARLPGSRSTLTGGVSDWVSLAEQEAGRKLKASEVDNFYYDKAWAFIKDTPGLAADLMLAKLQLFFWKWELPNNLDTVYFTTRYTPIVRYLPLTTGMVLPLGMVGLLLSLRQFKRLLPIWAFTTIYSLSVIAYFVCDRFRLPVLPLFLLFAAFFLVRWIGLVRNRKWSGTAGWSLLLILFWVAINRGVPQYMIDKNAARSHCQIGMALATEGDRPGAEQEYTQALVRDPHSVEAESSLAYLYLAGEEYGDAVKHFKKALEIDPAADVRVQMATALAMRGQWREAIDELRAGIQMIPGYLDLKRKLAYILSTCPHEQYRDGEEAVRLAEEVLHLGSEIPQTYDTLAVAYAESGRFSDAVTAGRKALELARSARDDNAMEQIQMHLREFERGKPFRQILDEP